MPRYTQPFYLDSLQQMFPFAEYGDTVNYFLRLQYYIDRDRYAEYATPPNTYPRLDEAIVAHNGKQIFRKRLDIFAGGRRFYLQRERATDDPRFPGVLKVEQVFGYAPAVTHTRVEGVDWQQPGIVDRSQANSVNITSTGTTLPPYNVEYVQLTDQFRVSVASVPAWLQVGDMVRIYAYYPQYGSWYPSSLTSDPTIVDGISGSHITMPAVRSHGVTFNPLSSFFIEMAPMEAANYQGSHVQQAINVSFNEWKSSSSSWSKIGAPGTPAGMILQLQKLASRIQSKSLSVGATVERTYFYASSGQPVQIPPLTPQIASGETVDVLDTNTQPTAAEYLSMVANGDRIRQRSESIGQVMGDVWFKDSYWLRAQLQ